MNKAEKEVARYMLQSEEKTLKELKQLYKQCKKDCLEKIAQLNARTDMINIQTIVYQQKYQKMILEQIKDVLEHLEKNEYQTVQEYLTDCYENGFIGTMYSIKQQGIPITVPIDQKQVSKAITINSNISKRLYTTMGENVTRLKNNIRAEVSRGIVTGKSWVDVAATIASGMNTPFEKAMKRTYNIARTEGHRVQEESRNDAAAEARKKGADQLKQWDATLDNKTRDTHAELDGKIVEYEEDFDSSSGYSAPYPGAFGVAEEDCNCRCMVLYRARWALGEDELNTLKERAEYFGLDKTKNFAEYKKKYLAITD